MAQTKEQRAAKARRAAWVLSAYPTRAEADDGTIGDALLPLAADHPLREVLIAFFRANPEGLRWYVYPDDEEQP